MIMEEDLVFFQTNYSLKGQYILSNPMDNPYGPNSPSILSMKIWSQPLEEEIVAILGELTRAQANNQICNLVSLCDIMLGSVDQSHYVIKLDQDGISQANFETFYGLGGCGE